MFSRSVVSNSLPPHGVQHTRLPLSFNISQSLLKFMSIESVMPSNYLILYHPLLLLTFTFPSIRVFPNESALPIRWAVYWSFSFTIIPMNIQGLFPLGLISLISMLSKGLSRVFSSIALQRHQFFGSQFKWVQIQALSLMICAPLGTMCASVCSSVKWG